MELSMYLKSILTIKEFVTFVEYMIDRKANFSYNQAIKQM